jgi:hypothetical protein
VIAAGAVLLAAALWDRPFTAERSGEATAAVSARCGGCSWASRTRTGAMLIVDLDGRYSQHLVLSRGEGPAEYRVALGGLAAGPHRLRIRLDARTTPPFVRDVAVEDVRIEVTPPDAPRYQALAFAPVLHPRLNAVGRYTDVPLVMWYETDRTPRGTRIRYSVVFSNEDGGTPADRLLATWGRLTDIEYVLGVELDREGRVLEATYQAKDHKILPYPGLVPGRHPALWVVTDNNMVAAAGTTRPVYAPAALPFDLAATSREAVMDAHPWTYQVSSQEAQLEGRVDDAPPAGSHRIFDPRRYVYVEACAETRDAALTFGLAVDGPDGLRWAESDAGQKEYRIVRQSSEFPNGCFRGAAALPADAAAAPIRALRFRAYTRRPHEGEAPLPPGTGRATVVRVNRVFRLGPDFLPGENLFTWAGALPLEADGPPAMIGVSPPATPGAP